MTAAFTDSSVPRMSNPEACRWPPPPKAAATFPTSTSAVERSPTEKTPLPFLLDQRHHDGALDGLQEAVQLVFAALVRLQPLPVGDRLPGEDELPLEMVLRPGEHLGEQLAR